MAKGIPDGITRDHVLLALKDIASGVRGDFGPSIAYDLIHEGRRYPPKSVLGLAAMHCTGAPLQPRDFKGGELSACFRILRELGFVIEPKNSVENDKSSTGKDWSEAEVRTIVEDYFAMLHAESRGQSVSKAEHRRRLLPLLNGRTEGAIEFKHQNISGVLYELGFPYIRGYKPARNYQSLLADVVMEVLRRDPMSQDIQDSTERPPEVDFAARGGFASLVVPPPIAPDRTNGGPRIRKPRQYDFKARDVANRELGRRGEAFVVAYEQWRLIMANRRDLAERVVWTSDELGDGAGYDIESHSENGEKIYIEVKTTNLGVDFPFLLSANEVDVSRELGAAYWLYRLYDFSREPRMYTVNGDLSQVLDLRPSAFESRGIKELPV